MIEQPQECPSCARAFKWGADADSAIVDARPGWRDCRENAYWKLAFHVESEHPETKQECPRRAESGLAIRGVRFDFWAGRAGRRACSYCGSMHPDELFAAIEAGVEIGPTDKNYKVYVHAPNPDAGKAVAIGSESGPAYDRDGKPRKPDLTEEEISAGRYKRDVHGPASATLHLKFYFQHLDEAQQRRFIELLNAKSIKIGAPGRFYALPYFIAR